MSDHLQEKHNIRDQYKEHMEELARIQNALKDDDFQKENGMYYCTQPNCEYSTRWMMCYHTSEGRDHKCAWKLFQCWWQIMPRAILSPRCQQHNYYTTNLAPKKVSPSMLNGIETSLKPRKVFKCQMALANQKATSKHQFENPFQIPYLYPDPTSSFHDPQVVARYPCPEPSCRFQTPFLHYGAYAAHKTQACFRRILIGLPW